MNPYLAYIEGLELGIAAARDIEPSPEVRAPLRAESKALLFSPHPDDECITGALPLRLMREAGIQIINIPVTFGSDSARRSARADELEKACAYLG